MNESGMGVIPPGGVYQFAEKLPNGKFHHLQGLTPDDLIRQVINYRVINNITVGNVPKEVADQLEGRSHITPQEGRSLRERVTNWKVNRSFTPLEFTVQEEAEERAKICADCPFNQVSYADDCKECYQGTTRDLFAMRQGRNTDSDPWLGACQICGHDNVTAVHLDDDSLKHRVNYLAEIKQKHPKCWLLALNKAKEVE